jgi:hypothetical protein
MSFITVQVGFIFKQVTTRVLILLLQVAHLAVRQTQVAAERVD